MLILGSVIPFNEGCVVRGKIDIFTVSIPFSFGTVLPSCGAMSFCRRYSLKFSISISSVREKRGRRNWLTFAIGRHISKEMADCVDGHVGLICLRHCVLFCCIVVKCQETGCAFFFAA
eukprot:GHVP01056156.1.p1 GENE.GHVP01056156.1~~GHVP01056156.1.p1  ORF type:complete len:118 (+),score=2.52 GHVP01056156.1:654-1007(+)